MAHNNQTRGAVVSRPLEADTAAITSQLQALLRDARARLTAPTWQNLDECRRRLEQAAEALRRLGPAARTGDRKRDSALRTRLQDLRAEISRVTVLLDSAASFHAGWMRLAASMVGGYTAGGTPAPPETGQRLWMEV